MSRLSDHGYQSRYIHLLDFVQDKISCIDALLQFSSTLYDIAFLNDRGVFMTGYSGTPLPKKLGLKAGQRALLLNVPKEITDISDYPDFAYMRKTTRKLSGRQFDYIHLFVKTRRKLETTVPTLQTLLKPDGMIWISWPKKSSGVKTDVLEGTLREVILPTGLVDVKVCAIDRTWSGLKFMFRKEIRSSL